MSETCKKTIGVWQLKDCGRPAKGRGDVIAGKNVPLCGVHLAAIKHRADNFERRKREIEKRDARDRRAIALSAARDDVVRAATVIAPDIAREHDDGDGYRTVSLDSAEAAAFCAAVSAYEKLAGGA